MALPFQAGRVADGPNRDGSGWQAKPPTAARDMLACAPTARRGRRVAAPCSCDQYSNTESASARTRSCAGRGEAEAEPEDGPAGSTACALQYRRSRRLASQSSPPGAWWLLLVPCSDRGRGTITCDRRPVGPHARRSAGLQTMTDRRPRPHGTQLRQHLRAQGPVTLARSSFEPRNLEPELCSRPNREDRNGRIQQQLLTHAAKDRLAERTSTP